MSRAVLSLGANLGDRAAALRTAIAAIDNAQAVPAGADFPPSTDGVIAHSSHGVGSAEAPRRELHLNDIHAIVRDLLGEYDTQREHYSSIHQHEAADRLRRIANVLRAYLPP